MELLLFLSAILTALTGAISGARAPEAQTHHACGAVAATELSDAVRVAPVRAVRAYLALAAGWPATSMLRPVAATGTPASFVAIPRYLDKLRN